MRCTEVYVTHVDEVKEYVVRKEGMKGVKVKYLIHAGVGAKKLQLRLFTIDVGGETHMESHEHEHEIFILRGKGLFRVGGKEVVLGPGNAIFIESYEPHQIVNVGDEPLQFLCTKLTSEIPVEIREEMEAK